ncbi:MAG: hypothetical protein K2X50_08560 [Gammaproteobacteria bacterium]|nr:hypothetical protein [Gammaproteobacteria bacterium]
MSESILLPKSHIFLRSAADMDSIMSPLKRVGINYLTFMRNYVNGYQIYLSNIEGWVEDYYGNELYRQFITNPPNDYKSCSVIWPKDRNLLVFDLAKERYNSDHGVTYIKTRKDYTDYYFFSTIQENPTIINFYLNHGDILEHFITYFEDRAESLIKKAEEEKVKLPQKKIVIEKQNELNSYYDDNNRLRLIKEMPIRKYRLKSEGYYGTKLSRQEVVCVINYVNRYTAEETGLKMNISKRTVEANFQSIKNKLGCDRKEDIVRILIQDGFDLLKSEIAS